MGRRRGGGRGFGLAAMLVGAVVVAAAGMAPGCTPAQGRAELLPEGTPGVTGTTDPTRPRPGDYSDIDFKGQIVYFQGFTVKLLTGTFRAPASAVSRRTLVVTVEATNTVEMASYFYGNFALEDDPSELGIGTVADPDSLKILPGATATVPIEIALDRPVDRTRAALV